MAACLGGAGDARSRVLLAARVLALAGLLTSCGGEATKAAGEVSAGTYVDGSSQAEYCDQIASADLRLVHNLAEAEPKAMLPAINAFGDIVTLAPEESKGDWAQMRALLQVVVDVNGDSPVNAGEVLASADAAYGDVSARLAAELEEICGLAVD